VAVRPLRVVELAEVLAIDFGTVAGGGTSKLNTDWRWEDQEQAVLSTCSSLIAVVDEDGDQIVQFSHFSVKEFLTSPRLAGSTADVSCFHILLEPAHTILAKACLGVLLRLDDCVDKSDTEDSFPLARYAAEHWVTHAQYENVSSLLREGMETLFDPDRPYFSAWIQVHDMDIDDTLWEFTEFCSHGLPAAPLYYAALCGFHDLAEHLIVNHQQDVNSKGGYFVSPLAAALGKEHFKVARLLQRRGADLLVRGKWLRTMLHAASISGHIELAQWLLSHGADPNVRQDDGWTPMHLAAFNRRLDVVRILHQHNADINPRENSDRTPIHLACDRPLTYQASDHEHLSFVRFLLEQGADVNACDYFGSTPLHLASRNGMLEVARLLVEHGAVINAEDNEGRTQLEVASKRETVELLSS
jgi:hypothetical protein